MFFGVVEPMSCSTCANHALELRTWLVDVLMAKQEDRYLVCLNPDDFVYPLIPPHLKTFSSDFHGTACHPKEKKSFVLEQRYWHSTHFIVFHCTVGQLGVASVLNERWSLDAETYAHVYIPWRVGHDNMKFTQDRVIKSAKVTVDPLRWELKL